MTIIIISIIIIIVIIFIVVSTDCITVPWLSDSLNLVKMCVFIIYKLNIFVFRRWTNLFCQANKVPLQWDVLVSIKIKSSLTYLPNKRCPLLGEMAPVTLFKPGSSWKELLFDPALVELFFKVQILCRDTSKVHHLSNFMKRGIRRIQEYLFLFVEKQRWLF